MAKDTITPIGSWSEMKIQIVRDYAQAYSGIMNHQAKWLKNYAYIDGFAGAGKHKSRRTNQEVDGSPRAVLQIDPPFPEYHFVELDPKRAALLKDLEAVRPGCVTVHHGDANEKLLNDILPRFQRKLFTRALLLLDPYNIGIDWRVTQAAGASRAIDMFLNFMVMDANMNAIHLDPETVEPEQAARMDRFWGDNTWRNVMYRKPTGFLPGFQPDRPEKQSNDTLATAFAARLRSKAGFAHVAKPLQVRSDTGRVLYYLYFASHNDTALKIATHLLREWGG
jgi:three-Cys-motif partner protein